MRDPEPRQSAACWIAATGDGSFYVANAGSATLSGYHVDGSGTVTLLPSVATTAGGPIDLVASPDGRFVYSENGGAGTIDEFAVQADGSLAAIGQSTRLDAHVIEPLRYDGRRSVAIHRHAVLGFR